MKAVVCTRYGPPEVLRLAGREALLGRGHRGHDVGSLGTLRGAQLLAEAADGGGARATGPVH